MTSIPLFFTRKKTLLDGFVRQMKSHKPGFFALLINDISELAEHHSDFEACDMVLFDINEDPQYLELASHLLDEISVFVPLIALKSVDEIPPPLRQQAGFLRLAGIASLKKGWASAWENVMEIRSAWKSPFMHSRIQDVSPSDVLQMIGISQWTAIVRLEGRPSNEPAADEISNRFIRGCISFVKGVPESAWSTNNTGIAAIGELLSLSHGTLEVIRRVWAGGQHNVDSKIEEILFAFALGMDESRPKQPEPPAPVAAIPDLPLISRWPETRQRHILDRWWNRNSQAIAQTLKNSNGTRFPLRWMKWRELERLISSEIQTKFIIVLGDERFILSHLAPYTNEITGKKLVDNELPVVRLDKFENDFLYLIGIMKPDAAMHILNRFPFILSGDGKQSPEFLSSIIKKHARAAVILSDDAETSLKAVSSEGNSLQMNFCCLQAAVHSENYSAAATFAHIAESLARMTEEPSQ